MYYVYVLKSEKDKKQIYKGFTLDLKERLASHNRAESRHTSKFMPWRIAFYCAFANKAKAIDFEKYLKSGSGQAFLNKRLID